MSGFSLVLSKKVPLANFSPPSVGRLVEDVNAITMAEQVAERDHCRVVLGVDQIADLRSLPARSRFRPLSGVATGSLAIFDGPSTASEVMPKASGNDHAVRS